MKKNILLLITIIISNLANAQNVPDITGLYNLGSSSPEGGSHLFVLENGNYAITYFGGIITGNWKFTEDNIFKFTPNIKESKFELSGRHNKNLNGNTKIFFDGFENSETFIQLRTTEAEEHTLQRVFNIGANCFSPPYAYTFKTIAHSISFMFIRYGDIDNLITTIENPDGYNDFVANFIEIDNYEAQPFFVEFKNDKLYFEEHNAKERSPLDEVGEDLEFIKKFIEMESNKDTIYLNPSYNKFGRLDEEVYRDINEHHVFNEQKNAFIDAEYYVEGVEHINSEESYEDMSIIYAYSALMERSKKSAKYKIIEKPLFQVNCD
ncbi:hypothetical protein [Spongiimicrobium sp. 3-5]|uniref:hypothetical protein n=1 Tax=Spongiimicrobium sp. 3-5 TaxID=3332596 RepID=UPI00397E9467